MPASKKRKPLAVIGTARQIRIYAGGPGREGTWLITYRENGKRLFNRVTGPFTDAEKKAREKLTALDNGTAVALGQVPTTEELDIIKLILQKDIHPQGLRGLVSDYEIAEKILGIRPDLPALARHYAKTDPSSLKSGSVAEIVELYLADRALDKPALSRAYLHLLKATLTPLGRDFPGSLSSIDGEELQSWVKDRGAAKTQANAKGVLSHFFNWSRTKKYLPREAKLATDDLSKIRREVKATIRLHTPEDLRIALDKVDARWRPFLAISAFAGIRSAEISRLGWNHVNLTTGYIEVAADKAKTRARRLVPICPALKAWLKPLHGKSLAIAPEGYAHEGRVAWGFREALAAIKDKKGKQLVPTIKNGWRSSFISYRLQELENKYSAVAEEAGNSESIIISNYRELTDKPTAKRWFAIMPK
jgi:integrase